MGKFYDTKQFVFFFYKPQDPLGLPLVWLSCYIAKSEFVLLQNHDGYAEKIPLFFYRLKPTTFLNTKINYTL